MAIACEQMFPDLDGDIRSGAPAVGEHFSLEKGCGIGQKLSYKIHCKGPTGLCPRGGRKLNGCLLSLCLEMFLEDQYSPGRPRLVDVVSLVLWGEQCHGVCVLWASLCACRTHQLYGMGAPEVTLCSVLWLRCDEVRWAESPVDSEEHLYASLCLWAKPSVWAIWGGTNAEYVRMDFLPLVSQARIMCILKQGNRETK